MAKYGFLSVLEEEMDKHFQYDYAIDWQKKNHAVEVSFVLEVPKVGILKDSDEEFLFEEAILLYNGEKSKISENDYLTCLSFDAKKGFSREFLNYLADFLNHMAETGLDGIMDFLLDESKEEFVITWDKEAFDNGLTQLEETTFYPYPRY